MRNAAGATPEEYDEYERLLSKRLNKRRQQIKALAAAPDADEVRLRELTKKLFGV